MKKPGCWPTIQLSLSRFVLISAVFISGLAWSMQGSLQISPLRLVFVKAAATSIITVKNRKDEPTLLQLDVVKWSQQDGQDIYEPTQDILASPPVFTVKPDSEQIIRVGLRKPPDAQNELSYRLQLREVPDQTSPNLQTGTVRVMIGFSLPVFVSPAAKVIKSLEWKASLEGPQSLRIHLLNHGNAHIQIKTIQILESESMILADMNQMSYVLAQQQRSWLLPLSQKPVSKTLSLMVNTDDGGLRANVQLERP